MTVPQPIRYVALGDSTGVGVGSRVGGGYVERIFRRLQAGAPEATLLNLCVSRASSANVVRSQLPRVRPAQPTLVTVGIGINDITHGVPVEDYVRNVDTILRALTADTAARVVLCNLPDVSHAPRVPAFLKENIRERLRGHNARLATLAAQHDVTLADVFTPSLQLMPGRDGLFGEDGFHPSDAGYALWAEQLWPFVARAVGWDRAQTLATSSV
ncbi:MAG: GDSL-type esterase/lipase family protein [Myxococcota bacterium]